MGISFAHQAEGVVSKCGGARSVWGKGGLSSILKVRRKECLGEGGIGEYSKSVVVQV